MTQDVEMKEQQPALSNSVSSTGPSVFQHLKDIASLIETGAYAREVRRIARAVRLTMALRKKLKASTLNAFLNFILSPGSEVHSRLSSYLPKGDEHDMEVDTATSATQAPVKHSVPELEIYCYLLVLIFLIDQKKYSEAKACSSASIVRLKTLNRRTVDVLASRLYYYYSLSYELTGDLAEIRGDLLALHRIATLRHDELGQETILNLLLRNYLHYNLYDQAEKLRSKAPRFEAHSNQHSIYIFQAERKQIRMAGSVISKTIFIALFFCFLLIASFGVETAEAQRGGGGGGGGGGKNRYCQRPAGGCCGGGCSKMRCDSWCKGRGNSHHGDCKRNKCYCYKRC